MTDNNVAGNWYQDGTSKLTMQRFNPGKWTAYMFDGYVQFTPPKGQEPNAFHRLMQRLAFGVVWKQNATAK
jgi:hypothetical protein